jgi:hypothetical protein
MNIVGESARYGTIQVQHTCDKGRSLNNFIPAAKARGERQLFRVITPHLILVLQDRSHEIRLK